MTRGEEIRVLEKYDLFDVNIKGEKGIYLSTDKTTGKHLVYFSINGEYAELPDDFIKRLDPGKVSLENQEFVDRIKTMKIPYAAED